MSKISMILNIEIRVSGNVRASVLRGVNSIHKCVTHKIINFNCQSDYLRRLMDSRVHNKARLHRSEKNIQ